MINRSRNSAAARSRWSGAGRDAQDEQGHVINGPSASVPGEDLVEVVDGGGSIQAAGASQSIGQGFFSEQRTDGWPRTRLFPGLCGAVGVEQQGLTGRQPEPHVRELDSGDYPEQGAASVDLVHVSVGPAYQRRGVPGAAQAASHAAWGDAEGGVGGGHEPVVLTLVKQRGVRALKHGGRRKVLPGVGAQGLPGQGRDLGGFHALAAHVTHDSGPPRPLDVEQVVKSPTTVVPPAAG